MYINIERSYRLRQSVVFNLMVQRLYRIGDKQYLYGMLMVNVYLSNQLEDTLRNEFHRTYKYQ